MPSRVLGVPLDQRPLQDVPLPPDSPPASPKSGPEEEEGPKFNVLPNGKVTVIPVNKRILNVIADLDAFANNPKTYLTQGRFDKIKEVINSSSLNKLIDRPALITGLNDLPPVARKGGKKTGRNEAARELIKKEILNKALNGSDLPVNKLLEMREKTVIITDQDI